MVDLVGVIAVGYTKIPLLDKVPAFSSENMPSLARHHHFRMIEMIQKKSVGNVSNVTDARVL